MDKQIELVKKQAEKIDSPDFNLEGWKSSTKMILSRIFGDDHQGIKAIDAIKYSGGGINPVYWDNLDSCKKVGKDILGACVTELKTFGQPEKKENIKSGININLSQHQTVNITLLISAIEDELTVTQLKELNEIMKTYIPKSEKKIKIIEKIKSFGSDVASKILANILTNPNIWA